MSKTEMLSISHHSDLYISSTDIAEVKFFEQMLIEKFSPRGDDFKNTLMSLEGYSLTYKLYNHATDYLGDYYYKGKPDPKRIFTGDLLWWLYQVALERGWQPFGKVGTFVRHTEVESSQ